jgi:D-aspartate ligase
LLAEVTQRKRGMSERRPAVIICGRANGLGVVRSLAKGHVPTIVVGTTLRHAVMWTRSAQPFITREIWGQRFIDDLLTLQRSLGSRPVLVISDERAVETVSQGRAELELSYRFHMPSAEMVTTLGNKALFHRFAERHDLPVPRTVIVEREGDIAKLSALRFPLVAKPADKTGVHLARTERASRMSTTAEAEHACRQMLKGAGQLVVQEWVEGPDSEIYFCLFHCEHAGRSRSMFFGRKMASHPPGIGSTAICVAAPETAEPLRPVLEKFLDVAEYEGLGSLEFKWDAHGRRFFIIEPTVGRTDMQEEIATLNGVNLPLIAYCSELGLPPPAITTVRPAAWRETLWRRTPRAGLAAGTRTYDAYWRVDDPLPALAFAADKALGAARRLISESLRERARLPVGKRRVASEFAPRSRYDAR